MARVRQTEGERNAIVLTPEAWQAARDIAKAAGFATMSTAIEVSIRGEAERRGVAVAKPGTIAPQWHKGWKVTRAIARMEKAESEGAWASFDEVMSAALVGPSADERAAFRAELERRGARFLEGHGWRPKRGSK